MTATMFTSFLGWSLVINTGILMFTACFVMLGRGYAVKIHGRIFGLSEEKLTLQYFQYLAIYKIFVLVFNLTPYLAMKIILA